MNSQSQRLRKDLCEALTEPLPGFTLYLGSNSDITVWYIEIAIEASSESLLSGKSVFFELRFPFMYPRLPPILTTLTTIPHSCMTEDSLTVCLDMLNPMSAPMRYGGWSASFTPASILRQLQAFFSPELIDVTDSCLKEIDDFHINVFPTLRLQRLGYKSISHHVNLDDQRRTKPALTDSDEKTVDKASTEVVNSVKRRSLRPGGQSSKIKLNDGFKDGVVLSVENSDLSPLQKPQELEKKSLAIDTDLEMLARVEAKVFSDNIQFSNEFDRHIWHDIIKPTLAPGSIVDNMESSNCTDSTGVTTAYSDLTVTRRSSGSFKGLSTTIIQHILSFCDPRNIAQTMASCKFMYSIITEGFLWKSMVNRHFPGCNIRPPLSTQTGKAWYRIWQLEINGVYYDELNCFYSKKNMNEDVMGIPLDFSINPKTKKIDHIYSTMELLGFGSFKRSNGNTSVWGEEVKGWLPVYLNEEHFRRALPKLAFGLRNLRDSLRAVDSSKDDDNASITSNRSHQRSQRTDDNSDSIAPSGVWGRNQQLDASGCVNSRSRSSSISSNSSDYYSSSRDAQTEKRNIILTKPSWALGGNGSLQSLVDNSRSSSTTHSTSISSGRQNPALKTVRLELAEPLIDVNIVLEVLPRLMSTMVLLLLDDGVDELDQAVRGYGMLHRLFVALVQEFPELKAEISRRLRTFINDKNARVKSACHNIGEFLPLLSVCDDVSWQDIVVPLIEESFSRGVMWICRDVLELSTATKEHPNIDLLDRIFKASKTSRNIYTFHCCFLHMFQTKSRSTLLSPSNADIDSTTVPNTSSDFCAVTVKNTEPCDIPTNRDHTSATRGGACLEGLCNLYDKTLGVTPLHVRRNLARLLKSAKSNTTWERYFDAIGYPCPTEPELFNMWIDAVQASLNKGYHTKDTDFSKIHRGGISNIILRGKSYSGVVLCIDVSGSMGQTMHHSDSNSYFSRLDFVKMQLEDIFCSKLTNRQKFTVIKFNHYAEKWSSTLMQATDFNLHKATQAVNRWHADGGTNMEAALEMSFAVPGVTAVYLLSDGEVGNHEEIEKKVMKWSNNGRINCHTTALYAPPSGQELLRNIAEATNGTYVYYG